MSSPQCCENPPTPSPNSGVGSVIKLGSLNSYVSGPSDSKVAVILFSDVYGYEAPNLRKLADKVATNGYYVVVPDFLNGDPYDPQNTKRSLKEYAELHPPEKAVGPAKSVIADLRRHGISAIGAAGFCVGAKVVVELAKSDLIQAAVLLHPTFCSVEDIKEVRAPTAVLGAEFDKISPPELLKQFAEILSAKSEVAGYVKIFAGVRHGWTVRYKVEDLKAVRAAEEAHQDMLYWFNKYLNVTDKNQGTYFRSSI